MAKEYIFVPVESCLSVPVHQGFGEETLIFFQDFWRYYLKLAAWIRNTASIDEEAES